MVNNMKYRLRNTLLTLLVIVLACSFSLTATAAPYLQKLEGAVIRDMTLYDPDPNTEDDEQLILLVWTLSETIKYCDDDGELDCNNTQAYGPLLDNGDLYLIRINVANNQITEHLKALETENGGGNSIRDGERIEMITVADVIYIVASTSENGVVTRVFSIDNDSGQFDLLQDNVAMGKNAAETSPRTVMTSVNVSQVSPTQSLMTLLVDWRAENGDVSNDGKDEHTRLYQYDIDHSGNGYSFTGNFEKYSLMRSRVVDIDDVTQFVVTLPEQSVPIPTRSAEAIVDDQGNIYTFQGVEQINHGNYLIKNKNFTPFPGLFAGVSVYNQDTSTDTNFKTANFEDDFTGLLDTPDWSDLRVSGIDTVFFDTRKCAISNPEFFVFDASKSHTCSIKFDLPSFQFSNTDNDHYHQMRTLLKVPEAKQYTFALSNANDYVRLVVNGDIGRAISHDYDDGSNPTTLTVELREGFNSIWIEHFDTNNGSHRFDLGIYEGSSTNGSRIFERATLENGTYAEGSGFNTGRIEEGYGFFVPKYLNKAFDIQLDSISGGYKYDTFEQNFPQGNFAQNNLPDDYAQVREGFRANLDDYFRAQLDIEPENTAQALIVKRSDDGAATALQAFKDEKPEQALFANARLYLASRFIQTKEDVPSSDSHSELRTRSRGLKISALQTSSLNKIQIGPNNNQRPLEATVTTQSEQYFGDVLAFERDSSGNIYVVASMGYINDDNPVTLIPRFENADGSVFATDNNFAGATFFVGKLNRDLQWQWVAAPSTFESNFLPPQQQAGDIPFYQIPLSFSPDENVLYVGGLVNEGQITLQNRSSQSAVSATFSTEENTAASFIAGIEVSSGAWLDFEGLMVESEFAVDLIVPAVGAVQIVNGETVTVSAPRLYYINAEGDILFDTSDDSLLNREEDGNDVRAVTRYRCTGIEINGIRQSTDSCDTTFTFREKTDIKFNWQVEHLLNIQNDFQNQGISNAVPAPEPLAGRHWLVEGQSSTLTIDGVVSQLGNSEQRELLYAVDIEGQGASAPFFRAGEVLSLEADNDVFKTEDFDVSLVKDDFKIEFWAYLSSTQENGRLLTIHNDTYEFIDGIFGRDQMFVDFDDQNALIFNVQNNGISTTFPISGITVQRDRWVHYSFTFDFQGEFANDTSPAQRLLETLEIKTEVNITNAERATDIKSLAIGREVRLNGQVATLDIGRTNIPFGLNPTNIDLLIDDVRIWQKVNDTYPAVRIDRPIEEEDLEETEGLLAYFNFDNIPKTDRNTLTIPDISGNWIAGVVENYTALSEGTLPAVELAPGNQRQQPLSFIASQPVSVTYRWKTQFTVNTNVNNSAYETAPSMLVNSVSRENVASSTVFTGTGEHWIDFRSDVNLLVPANLDLGALEGYINATGLPSKFPQNTGAVADLDTVCFDGLTITDFNGSTCPTFYNLQINSFAEPLGIQWSYNVLTLEVELNLGESISLRRIIAPDPNNEPLSGTVNGDLLLDLLSEDRLEENAATGSVVSGPSGSTLNDMVFFSELEREFYALRPGLTSLEFAVNNTSNPMDRRIFRVEVTSVWPSSSDYTYVIDTPAVQLDRGSTDFWAYADLAYTEVDAENIIQANSFSYKSQDNRNPDNGSEAGKRSLLLFTCTQKDLPSGTTPAIASGNINTEPLCPRTVVLQSVESVTSVGAQEWNIGSEIIDDTLHTAPHSGYVFNALARYNRYVYQPERLSGPIFPVNQQFVGQQEHDLVVVWYRNRTSAQIAETGVSEPVYWPTSAIKYEPKWPTSRTDNRIVVASQLGSEGVQFDGETTQLLFDADSVTDVSIYNQPNPMLAGYNPNEEHALISDSTIDKSAQIRPAAFALRNDLNILTQDESYTSSPYVLVQYRNLLSGQSDDWRMLVYEVQLSDQFTPHVEGMTPGSSTDSYSFEYTMKAGEPVTALYPLNIVQGIQIPEQNWGHQGASPTQNVYWQDFEGKAYAISGDARLYTYQWYPMREDFWWPDNQKVCYNMETPTLTQGREYEIELDGANCYDVSIGSLLPLGEAIPGGTPFREIELTYNTQWPEDLPTLKAGETLTFSGGENNRDDSTQPGLSGVVAFKTGELIFDSSNPTYGIRLSESTNSSPTFAAQLAQVLEKREVSLLATGDDEDEVRETNDAVNTSISLWLADGSLSVGKDGFYYFTDLPASLQTRVYIDNVNSRLGFIGLLNNKGIGESTLTASPGGGSYTLRPNIMSDSDSVSLLNLCSELECSDHIAGVIDALKNKTRRPHQTCSTGILPGNTLGQDSESTFPFTPGLCESDSEMRHGRVFGPGLALIPNDGLLSEDTSLPDEIYVTLAENNDPDAGGPVTLPIIKIEREQKFRGEIVVLTPSNVFDEKSVLRHTADFGASGEDIVYDWYYRLDDGATTTSSSLPASNGWTFFGPGQEADRSGLNEVSLEGNAAALLADNLFYVRYRHKDCPADDETCYSDWAGASNNNPSANVFQPQLVQGWVKRVVDRVNAFEARISDFYNADAPATYVSMIQQAGQAYNGPIALNADQNVIENAGLIQLYETVLKRALSLSIDSSQSFANEAIYTTLQLASSRLAQLYTLLGNEAYIDALDPTIGFDTESGEYGSLAPSIYSFENQLPSLLEEELSLLRGRNRRGAAPSFNRLVWNFTIGEGEVAYAQNYNISDVDTSGFVDLADAQQLFPQGHGDAWGHYSKALRYYYDLVKNPHFNWVPAGENVAVGGQVIEVDFNDEQRFAEMAAAKAKTGFDVVGLTYRQYYVENISGQWQGYKDRDTQRAWGVTEWAQRATTGAYFDWVLANAILPEETASDDTDDLFNISRATVPEVEEIAAQAEAIYAMLDDADSGKNPLGLLPGVVPFDIDPVLLDRNSTIAATHFEQIADRAEQALDNAFKVFDFANQQKNRIREVANTAESLLEQAIDQDTDFRNRLIEIYGTPHEGNIGSGKAYPAGYDGPDTIFWAYIDTIDIINENVGDGYKSDVDKDTFEGAFESFMLPQPTNISSADVNSENLDAFVELVANDTNISNQELKLSFPQDASNWGFVKPSEWGERRASGRLQQALIELVKAEADLSLGVIDYHGVAYDLNNAITDIQAYNALNTQLSVIRNDNLDSVTDISTLIADILSAASFATNAVDTSRDLRDALVESFPSVSGTSNDTTFVARSSVTLGYSAITAGLSATVASLESAALNAEAQAEIDSAQFEIDIANAEVDYELGQKLRDAERILADEEAARFVMFKAKETMRQAADKVRSIMAEGLRLQEQREIFNKRLAAKIQGERYKDMTFRIGQYDALQKYRAAFDLAARYAYLAASVYDYETNLAETDPRSSLAYMTQIVKERVLGEQATAGAVTGAGGLSELLSTMQLNFDTLKTQMGFNNPQTETGRFSLRFELARNSEDESRIDTNEQWRNWLAKHRVDNLWDVPEYRRFARNFAAERDGPQPALVIPFPTIIKAGRNFFDFPLAGGDNAYDPTNFATKVRSVGLWFENYNNANLAQSPRVYLFPTGNDVMYVPTSGDLDTRDWKVIDQRIPVPFPLTSSSLEDRDFIPVEDTLVGDYGETRRHSSFRAYHDGGDFDENEAVFDSRLIGRSVWNTNWVLIIPGQTLLADSDEGLDTFIYGKDTPSNDVSEQGQKDGNGISDIKLFFQTYSYSGN